MNTLTAIDRLNSWVRSDSARGWFSSPRYAIYDWKHALIEQAILTGAAECSAVHLTLNCRDCGGSGKYVDSYGQKFDHCRKCYNTGRNTLHFLVTAMGEIRWHTPRDKAWRFRLPEEFWKASRLSVDWEPNQKGRDLETWEVAECLNVCEAAVQAGELPRPGSHGVYSYGEDFGEVRHDRYKLNLGRSEPVCEFCGAAAVLNEKGWHVGGVWHHVIREYVDWSAWACDSCRESFGRTTAKIFDQFRFPEDQASHPAIQEWLARRGAHAGSALREVAR